MNKRIILLIAILLSVFKTFSQDTTSFWIPGDTSHFRLLRMFIEDEDFLIKLDSNNSIPYMKKGIYKLRMNELNGSIEDLTYAIKLENDPHLIANMYAWIGSNYDRLGKYEEAKNSFTQAITIGKGHERPVKIVNIPELDMVIDLSFQFYNRGIINNRLKMLSEAKSDFNSSLKLNSNLAEPYFGLGLAYEHENNLDSAIFFYHEAINKNSMFISAYNNLANVYMKQMKYDLAIQNIEKALIIKPDYINALISFCDIKQQMGDLKGACETANELVKLYKGIINDKTLADHLSKYCE